MCYGPASLVITKDHTTPTGQSVSEYPPPAVPRVLHTGNEVTASAVCWQDHDRNINTYRLADGAA
ncbi:hypothetical protein PHISCL_03497 [Aspergillus sclerotialis]|uniref:Uncharacterized protein n=1 Tax=Aspergillus sclerotialis TaxID=2070753 RepID=A0A3A2ZLV1_9EURO|nr:hypothetical protein PHISCL_03497 [Aspergillus sclerotialis]